MGETLLTDLIVKISSEVSDFEKGMEKVEKKSKTTFEKMKSYADTASTAMLGIGTALLALGKKLADGAIEDEAWAKQLRRTIGDVEKTERAIKKLDDVMKNGIGFSEDDLKESIQALGKFRTDVDRTLDAAMNMAAGTGASLNEASQIIGLFATGNSRAMMMLQRQMGITKDEIMQFSKSGKADLEALLEYIEKRWPNAAKEMANETTGRLQDIKNKFEVLKDTVGAGAVTAFGPWMDKLNELATKFNDLPDSTKQGFGELIVNGGALYLAGGAISKVVSGIAGIIKKLNDIPGAAKLAGTGILGIAGPLAIVGETGRELAQAALDEMHKVNAEAWKLKREMLGERGMAQEISGLIEAWQTEGVKPEDYAKKLQAKGYKTEDLVSAKGGMQTLVKEAKTREERDPLLGMSETIHKIAQDMKEMKPVIEQEMISPFERAQYLTKEIEHNLKMGIMNQHEASSKYQDVANYYRQAMGEKSGKEARDIQELIWSAEERSNELGWKEILKAHPYEFPELPKTKTGKSDVEGFKKRMEIDTESKTDGATSALQQMSLTAINTAGALETLKKATDQNTQAQATQAQATYGKGIFGESGFSILSGFGGNLMRDLSQIAPHVSGYGNPGEGILTNPSIATPGDVWRQMLMPDVKESYGEGAYAAPMTKEAYAQSLRGATKWEDYQAQQGREYANMSETEKIKWREQQRGESVGGGSATTRGEVGALVEALKNMKIGVDLTINGRRTSDYTDGQTAVEAKINTPQPSYKQLTQQ